MIPFASLKWKPKRLILLGLALLYIPIGFYVIKTATDRGTFIRNELLGLANTLEGPPVAPLPESKPTSDVIAVLVLVCDRLTLQRTLSQLMEARASSPKSKFPIVISQDCGMRGKRVKTLVRRLYGDRLTYLTHPNYEASMRNVKKQNVARHMQGYYHIAAHYGWALNYTFLKLGYENVIVVEDDLDIAPDFFEYFEATLPFLKSDPTLWCVSAYNDNGMEGQIDETKTDLLYRTDFFPGLGWMLTKSLWKELNTKWPEKFWDDWMRNSEQRKGRACVHPEVSRTKTFGRVGASNGQFFDKFLDRIVLNHEFVPFKDKKLGYLVKEEYDYLFMKRLQFAIPVSTLDKLLRPNNLDTSMFINIAYKFKYENQQHFATIANEIGIMNDFKDGVMRNGYMGIVPVMYHGRRVYLVPSNHSVWNRPVDVSENENE